MLCNPIGGAGIGCRGGKSGEKVLPCHIGVARGVNRDTDTEVKIASAEVSGIAQNRVDDQGFGDIIAAYCNADLVSLLQHIPCFDQSFAIADLVSYRLMEANFAACIAQLKVPTFPIDADFPRLRKTQLDGLRVRSWGHHKVILQLPLVAVVN